MSNDINNLEDLWNNARKETAPPEIDFYDTVARAEKQKAATLRLYFTTISILTFTLAGIILIFAYVFPFQETLSLVGEGLMIGGLAVRIIIELVSIYRSKRIDMKESAAATNESFLKFYATRKMIHGPVTITILVLYSIGFYLFSPEFSKYLSTSSLVLIDLSYVAGAVIFSYSIRMSIRKEKRILEQIMEIKRSIAE